MTHPQDTTSEVVARLKPSAVVDHVPGLAVSASRSAGDNELAERLNEWIVRNNALKSDALALIADLTKRVGELEGALERKQDMLETLVSFVHRWTWEKEGNGTTDAERLDVIKHYPPIAARRLTGGEG